MHAVSLPPARNPSAYPLQSHSTVVNQPGTSRTNRIASLPELVKRIILQGTSNIFLEDDPAVVFGWCWTQQQKLRFPPRSSTLATGSAIIVITKESPGSGHTMQESLHCLKRRATFPGTSRSTCTSLILPAATKNGLYLHVDDVAATNQVENMALVDEAQPTVAQTATDEAEPEFSAEELAVLL